MDSFVKSQILSSSVEVSNIITNSAKQKYVKCKRYNVKNKEHLHLEKED